MNTATLDHAAGAAAKHSGMQLALTFAGDWKDEILGEFRAWSIAQQEKGLRTAKIEEFRAATHVQPKSNKAWGALPRLLIKAGMIRPLLDADGYPIRRPAAAGKTHAHPVIVYSLEAARAD